MMCLLTAQQNILCPHVFYSSPNCENARLSRFAAESISALSHEQLRFGTWHFSRLTKAFLLRTWQRISGASLFSHPLKKRCEWLGEILSSAPRLLTFSSANPPASAETVGCEENVINRWSQSIPSVSCSLHSNESFNKNLLLSIKALVRGSENS